MTKAEIEAVLKATGLVEQDSTNDEIGFAVEPQGDGFVVWPMSQGRHDETAFEAYLSSILIILANAGYVCQRVPPQQKTDHSVDCIYVSHSLPTALSAERAATAMTTARRTSAATVRHAGNASCCCGSRR